MNLINIYCFAESLPPNEYIVYDRMSGEEEVEAKLKVLQKITLYNKPRGIIISGTVDFGEIVTRISSVAFTSPLRHPVKILKTIKSYSKYDSNNKLSGPTLNQNLYVYLVMYTGEGTYLGWYEGKEAWWLEGYGISNFSSNVNRLDAWGEYQGEMTDRYLSIEMWYCIRTNDGTTGWVLVQKNCKYFSDVFTRRF